MPKPLCPVTHTHTHTHTHTRARAHARATFDFRYQRQSCLFPSNLAKSRTEGQSTSSSKVDAGSLVHKEPCWCNRLNSVTYSPSSLLTVNIPTYSLISTRLFFCSYSPELNNSRTLTRESITFQASQLKTHLAFPSYRLPHGVLYTS